LLSTIFSSRWTRLALLTTLTGLLTPAADFKQYPGAKLAARPAVVADPEKKADKIPAKPAAVSSSDVAFFATVDDFARVAYHFRSIGKEQKMPDGAGDGTARATFTFDSGETVLIMHPRPTGDPVHDQTFIEVTKAGVNKAVVTNSIEAGKAATKVIAKPEPAKQVLVKPALPATKAIVAAKK
jgi:hypothetical protein